MTAKKSLSNVREEKTLFNNEWWLEDVEKNDEECPQIYAFTITLSFVAFSNKLINTYVFCKEKGICKIMTDDSHGHTLSTGEKYIRGKYLHKVR